MPLLAVFGARTDEFGVAAGFTVAAVGSGGGGPCAEAAATLPSANPTYVERSGDLLYVCHEVDEQHDGVSVWRAADWQTGQLEKLCARSTVGKWTCHLCVWRDLLFCANYGGGVAAFAGAQSGQLRRIMADRPDYASGVVADRQDTSHPHCVFVDEQSSTLLLTDLGADRIYAYDVDAAKETVIRRADFTQCPGGSGPRHFALHDALRSLYVSCELSNEVLHFKLSPTGELRASGDAPASTLLAPSDGDGMAADTAYPQTVSHLALHPNRKWMYVANRGPQSTIAVFAVDQTTGSLSPLSCHRCRGAVPRHFAITPDGAQLWAANQGALMRTVDKEAGQRLHGVDVFDVDKRSGALLYKDTVRTPTPMCVLFVQT